jgi:hypothetical protein
LKLAAVLATATLAACQSAPPAAVVMLDAPQIGQPRGIDLPIDASDVLNELKGSHVDFVARYYRQPTSRWPTLTAAEAQRLSSLGLKIVTVWESHSHNPAYFSYATGYNDALSAYSQARNVGQPPGSAIYFAVDFDARGEQLAYVDQYFRGIYAGMYAASGGRRVYKIGVYGSGMVCAEVRQAGLAQYSWLSNSTAWAGSLDYTDWNIRQSGRFASLSFNHDANEARDDFGGFKLANIAIAAPTAGAPAPAEPVTAKVTKEPAEDDQSIAGALLSSL